MLEKSGIQMIEELLGGQAILDRRIQVVEQLLKQLLATANTCPIPAGIEINGRPVRSAGGIEVNGKPVQPKPSIEEVVQEPLIRAAANARVVGRIVEEGKPVPEVGVTIYDDRNNAIRKTRTNRSGEWMAQLPPGKYAAECLLEGRINGNVVFKVGQEDKIVRVGQPQ
jgi:hypothetical protein